MNSNHPDKLRTSMPLEQTPASTGKPFDPWIIWVTFRRCWPWAVPVGTLLACVVAIVVKETFVPRYRASHWLEAQQDYLVYRGVLPTANDLARTERTFFYSPIILEPVLADPNLRKAPSLSDPNSADVNIRKNLSLESGGTSSRLIVHYTDTDPVSAAMVADAIAESYVRSRDSFDNQRVDVLLKWLKPELDRQENKVDEKRLLVRKLSEEALGFAPGQRLSMMEDRHNLATISDLQARITNLRVQLNVLDAKQKQDREKRGLATEDVSFTPPPIDLKRHVPSESDIEAAIDRDEEVIDANRLVQNYKATIENLEFNDLVRFDRARHRELEAKRDQAIAELEKKREAVRPAVLEQLDKLADQDLARRKHEAEQRVALLERKYREGIAFEKLEQEEAIRLEREAIAAQLQVYEAEYEAERERLMRFGGEDFRSGIRAAGAGT